MTLIKGKRYKRSDFGIRFPRTLVSSAEVNGETFFFINIGCKYNNELHNGGIIHEPIKQSEVVKSKTTYGSKIIRTFLRNKNKGEEDFEYIGVLDTVDKYDSKRNILTVK